MVPMKSPTMLYRKGTQERIHGVHVDWIIVDEHQVDDHLAQGWFMTPAEAGNGESVQEAERRVAQERAAEEAERSAALDAREKRLAAMQDDLERRLAELERAGASTKKATDKSDKPAAAEK
jgi:hypothetical protein